MMVVFRGYTTTDSKQLSVDMKYLYNIDDWIARFDHL